MNDPTEELIERIVKRHTDDGRLLEAGWTALKTRIFPSGAPPVQIDEMRKAFFCGADHLYSAIMVVLDPGTEPTDQDMQRMASIHQELEAFRMEVSSWHTPGRG